MTMRTVPAPERTPPSMLVMRTLKLSSGSSSRSAEISIRTRATRWPAAIVTLPWTVTKSLPGVALSPASMNVSKKMVTGSSYSRSSSMPMRA